jgi:hypothetical protein
VNTLNFSIYHTIAEFKSYGQPTSWYTSVANIGVDKHACFNKDRKSITERKKEIKYGRNERKYGLKKKMNKRKYTCINT